MMNLFEIVNSMQTYIVRSTVGDNVLLLLLLLQKICDYDCGLEGFWEAWGGWGVAGSLGKLSGAGGKLGVRRAVARGSSGHCVHCSKSRSTLVTF